MEQKKFTFNIFAFIIAFSLGILFVYLSAPKPRLIIKYPTPYNADKIVYKNENDICYKYKVNEVKCTDNSIEQPII
jgi:hypothetical protein